jgi:hypothetical protein
VRLARAGVTALAAAIVVATAVFATSAAHVSVMSPRLNAELGALAEPTVTRLGQIRASGRHGPYLVTWLPEPQGIGAEGYGLLNELLRHGFDAYASAEFRPGATRYHTMPPERATLLIHLATGPDIARWQADHRFEQVAYYDPRSSDERRIYDILHAAVVNQLDNDGRSDLTRPAPDSGLSQVDDNLFMLALNKKVPAPTRRLISRMLAMGLPAGVFIGPPVEPPRLP